MTTFDPFGVFLAPLAPDERPPWCWHCGTAKHDARDCGQTDRSSRLWPTSHDGWPLLHGALRHAVTLAAERVGGVVVDEGHEQTGGGCTCYGAVIRLPGGDRAKIMVTDEDDAMVSTFGPYSVGLYFDDETEWEAWSEHLCGSWDMAGIGFPGDDRGETGPVVVAAPMMEDLPTTLAIMLARFPGEADRIRREWADEAADRRRDAMSVGILWGPATEPASMFSLAWGYTPTYDEVEALGRDGTGRGLY